MLEDTKEMGKYITSGTEGGYLDSYSPVSKWGTLWEKKKIQIRHYRKISESLHWDNGKTVQSRGREKNYLLCLKRPENSIFQTDFFLFKNCQDSLSIVPLIYKYNSYFQAIEIFIYFLQQLRVNLGLSVQRHAFKMKLK